MNTESYWVKTSLQGLKHSLFGASSRHVQNKICPFSILLACTKTKPTNKNPNKPEQNKTNKTTTNYQTETNKNPKYFAFLSHCNFMSAAVEEKICCPARP